MRAGAVRKWRMFVLQTCRSATRAKCTGATQLQASCRDNAANEGAFCSSAARLPVASWRGPPDLLNIQKHAGGRSLLVVGAVVVVVEVVVVAHLLNALFIAFICRRLHFDS